MTETKKLQEIDLYKPIQTYFLREGYEVYGEVKDCDIVAVKDEELVVIELKLTLSVDLLIQAAKRQRITDKVYVAIPKPKHRLNSKRWTEKCHLIRRLELGMIVVSSPGKRGRAEIIFEPTPFIRRKNKRKRDSIMKEIKGRSADYNVGGSNRTKIMTAYKENCIQIACYLENLGPLSPKKLNQLGSGKNTSSVLTKNYYGWFERIKRGIYVITEKGKEEIKEYPELINYYLTSLGDDQVT
ncbi:hypothetical protein J7E79_25105 [Bacillus sp. ISL-40]|uniref:DUF2161 domain-containing phosphodiesterase n=1 Tax=unclassified Bacillus (in: firmicutes) TaxID=185979 RepID=UPI001BE7D8E2|nr:MULTISPECIES: DUF2161 family putative PD-(D/E)XK-type phosphodiesterase [unclassified Bacillus (in: firmicutes)]MBT2700620.1 hypothetical protein [Bacillus sp. ISL-40]MBT2744110.1 hypothetical protein [Bacillus sp. ISL-77]